MPNQKGPGRVKTARCSDCDVECDVSGSGLPRSMLCYGLLPTKQFLM